MSDAQWQFLGYDIRAGFRYIKAGWSDFFSSDASPVASSLHEPVLVHESETERYVVLAGKKVAGDSAKYEAVLLPASISLIKHLSLPVSAESDIDSFIGLEVEASSPFPQSDTLFGWKVIDRSDGQLSLVLAISSARLSQQFIDTIPLSNRAMPSEIWAKTEAGEFIAFQSEAYSDRVSKQRGKQKWLVLAMAYVMLALVAIAAVPVVAKFLEMREVRQLYNSLEQQANPVAAVRGDLAIYNQMATELNLIGAQQVDAIELLDTLSSLLPDDTYLLLLEYKNGGIRLDGRSSNAAMLLQQLDRSGAFAKVESIAGIRKEGRTGKERFSLLITPLSEEGSE